MQTTSAASFIQTIANTASEYVMRGNYVTGFAYDGLVLDNGHWVLATENKGADILVVVKVSTDISNPMVEYRIVTPSGQTWTTNFSIARETLANALHNIVKMAA